MTRLTLTQYEINSIKSSIATMEGKLVEDISDNEVFQFIRDVHESDDYLCVVGDNLHYVKPRTFEEVISSLRAY